MRIFLLKGLIQIIVSGPFLIGGFMKFKEEIVRIPLCEICEKEIRPGDPYHAEDLDCYCGGCALETGKISFEEYKKHFLYFIDPEFLKGYTLENALKDIKANRSSK